MFPNPQAALPVPPRSTVDSYKKLAHGLVAACKSSDPTAISRWSYALVKSLAKRSGVKFTKQLPVAIARWSGEVEDFIKKELAHGKRRCRLSDAQEMLAEADGFVNWRVFTKHLKGIANKSSAVARFEAAVEAIIKGDTKTLKRLLRADPKLVRQRSLRKHGATLLHYVSANGVEGYRQITPPNIVEITRLLLDAGAEVDAEADVYGGGCTALGLVGTSVHPYLAGVQNELMQVLLDHGADIDHVTSAGHQQNAVLGCLANGRPEAARYLMERGARLTLDTAAALGRFDVVKSFFTSAGKLRRGTTKKQLQSAFVNACGHGEMEIVKFLLDKGVSMKGHTGDGQTATHWAAIGGYPEMVELLLKYNPPLEARNMFGGTVLGQTLWSAAHGGDVGTYSRIIEILIKAGAKVPPRHVPVNKEIDALLERYGSTPEPTWYWFGEKPRS